MGNMGICYILYLKKALPHHMVTNIVVLYV